MEYQGWTNYETWIVHLWLSNDEASYDMALEQARREYEWESEADDVFKEFVIEIYDLDKIEGVAADLVNAAMQDVNWREVREAFKET